MDLSGQRRVSALREPPRRLEKAGKWAKNSKKEKGQIGLAIGQPFMNSRGREPPACLPAGRLNTIAPSGLSGSNKLRQDNLDCWSTKMKSNRRVSLTIIVAAAAILSLSVAAASPRAADANSAAPPKLSADPFVGEYVGTYTAAGGKTLLGVAKIYLDPKPAPAGGYRAMLYAVESGLIDKAVIGDKAKCSHEIPMTGTINDGTAKAPRQTLTLAAETWRGAVDGDKCVVGSKAGTFDLARYVRKSPTLGEAPPAGAVVLLDYKPGKAPSLAEWTNKTWKAFDDGSVMVTKDSNYTVRKFKSFRLHAEFMVVRGKGGGNSGFYLLDRYEVQVYDSFGWGLGKGNCAGIYQTIAPSANACLPEGQWQTYDITFRAPVMEGKVVKKHPRITVVHNGVTVHDDVEIPHATGAARVRGDAADGPIMLQDHSSPDRFRNIWIVEVPGQ